MLAHELRNPLAAIRHAVNLARRDDPQGDSRWSIDVIDRQAHRLTRLIDDLLDISRITQGKIRLRREPVDLASIVTSAVEAGRPLFRGEEAHTRDGDPAHDTLGRWGLDSTRADLHEFVDQRGKIYQEQRPDPADDCA